MANIVVRENFTGSYDIMTPPTTLQKGFVTDGLNMRKISLTGGWKTRRGSSLYKTDGFSVPFSGTWYGKMAISNDGTRLTIASSSDYIYVSTDGTASFNSVGEVKSWRDCYMSSDGQYQIALTYLSTLYLSDDYAASFSSAFGPGNITRASISDTGQYITVTDYNNGLQVSENYGSSFVTRGAATTWFGVAMSADGSKQTATTYQGQIYTTTDKWLSSTPRDSVRKWRSIAMSSTGQWQVACAEDEGLFVSSNTGTTWVNKDSANAGWWDVAISGDGKYMLASAYFGDFTGIKSSDDYGETWITRFSGLYSQPSVSISSTGQYQYISPRGVSDVPLFSSDYGVTFNSIIFSNPIKSLHWYRNPIRQDEHFIGQMGDNLLDLQGLPPLGYTSETVIGGVGANSGFSCIVNEDFFYADGSNSPLVWGGDGSTPLGFILKKADGTYTDDTTFIRDNRSDTYSLLFTASTLEVYLISSYKINKFDLTLGANVNSNSVTMSVAAWRGSAFINVSSLVDGTTSSGATLAIDGTVSWIYSASDSLTQIAGIMGFVYKITFSGNLSSNVTITTCFVKSDTASTIANKWSGVWENVDGVRLFKNAIGEYIEGLGKVSNESTSTFLQVGTLGTSDALYIKTVEPPSGFGIAIVEDYTNANIETLNAPQGWTGDTWSSYTGLVDTTKNVAGTVSLAQTGSIFFNGDSVSVRKRFLAGDDTPGYWTKITWSGELSLDVRIFFLVTATFPEPLGTYNGCIEFKDRLFLWGDEEFPNRLRYSSRKRPTCFSGSDSGYTDSFGDKSPILNAVKFYNELLVFKEKSIFLLEGDNPFNFGSLKITDTVGLASIKTAMVFEVGSPSMHRDEPLSVALWQDTDGVYALDGRKPRKTTEKRINKFFDPSQPEGIDEEDLHSLSAFGDPVNNEYHLLLPDKELVYNVVTDEWYPPWKREIDLVTATSFIPTDSYGYTYAGSSNGFILRLETTLNDIDITNTAVAINNFIKTRAVTSTPDLTTSLTLTLRKIWGEFKAETAGIITAKVFKDLDLIGEAPDSPEPMSLVNTGYNLVTPHLNTSLVNCMCFQIEFGMNTLNWRMEVSAVSYELEVVSLIGAG